MSAPSGGEAAQSAIIQAAANKINNQQALGAQGDDFDGSDASHTTEQLMQRAAITIQRRQRFGRIGRATPVKAAALVQAAREQSAASGIRLTDNTEVLEQLPIQQSQDGGSQDGTAMSALTDDGEQQFQSLSYNIKDRRKQKATAPINPDDARPNKDNDNNKHGNMQAPGPPTEPTGAAGGTSAQPIIMPDGGQPPNPDDLDDPLDATSIRQLRDELAHRARQHAEMQAHIQNI